MDLKTLKIEELKKMEIDARKEFPMVFNNHRQNPTKKTKDLWMIWNKIIKGLLEKLMIENLTKNNQNFIKF